MRSMWVSVGLGLVLAACGGSGSGMMGPSTMGVGAGTMPANAAAAMLVCAPMVVGMERYVDLHRSDLSGPVVPMSCALSADRASITCSPAASLALRTSYTLHVGAGMLDASSRPVDMSNGMGGQWIVGGGMMGTTHGGSPWGTMTGSWMGANGSYGMAFPFTTE